MDPFFDALPETVLGVPFMPFVVITTISGLIGMMVLGQEDSPALFIVSGLIGWISAHVYRFVGYIYRSVDWAGVGSTSLMVIIGIVVIITAWFIIAEAIDDFLLWRYTKLNRFISKFISPFVRAGAPVQGKNFYFVKQAIMYHGTRLEWARDILHNDRWKLGQTGGVFMTPDFHAAVWHANKGGTLGAVIELHVGPNIYLEKLSNIEFCARILGGTLGKYYRLKGVAARRLFDPHDKRRQVH